MPAPRISLEQWRALVAVVDEGGYGRAAAALHKSQSSVTYAVQQIESLLGVKAFRIEGRRAQLTPTGQSIYQRARYLLDEAAGLEQATRRLSAGWEAEVRLAAEVAFPTRRLLASLDRFGEEGPHTRVELFEIVFGHQTGVLTSGEIDLAIFGQVPPGFVGEPLMRLRFVPVASPRHALHRFGRPLTVRDLRRHRHLVVRESSAERPTSTRLESTQRWTLGHMSTSIEAACAGYGFAWLPEEKIRDELQQGLLAPLPLRDGGERFEDVYLIFADREHAGPATQRLAQILRGAAGSGPAGAGGEPVAARARRRSRSG